MIIREFNRKEIELASGTLGTGFSWFIPINIFGFLYGHIKGIRVFEVFIEGLRRISDGHKADALSRIYVAVGVFRESGGVDVFVKSCHRF